MLPGLRFLFAAVVLSVSMLVFGLGAAALLRASHDRFVSTPKIRSAPPPLLAQHTEPATPTLSLLRVEPQLAAPPSASEPGSVADSGADTPAAPTIASTEAATPAAPALATDSERSTLTAEDLKAAPVTAPPAAASQPDSPAPAESIAQADSAAKTDNASKTESKTDSAVNAAATEPAKAADQPAAASPAVAATTPAAAEPSSEPAAVTAARTDAAPAGSAAPADAAQPGAAPKAEDAVAAVSEEAVPVPPRLPAARPVIRTSKPKARRVAHKRKHVVRRRVAVPTAAEQSFLPGFGGT